MYSAQIKWEKHTEFWLENLNRKDLLEDVDENVRIILTWNLKKQGARVAQPVYFLTTYWTGRPGFEPRHRQRISPLASVSRPAVRPTQPPVQWVPGVLSRG
jgi:hypothetical protein